MHCYESHQRNPSMGRSLLFAWTVDITMGYRLLVTLLSLEVVAWWIVEDGEGPIINLETGAMH